MTDATDAETPAETAPELPEELYAVHGPVGWEGNGTWISTVPSQSIAHQLAEVGGFDAILIGVHPRHRDESEHRGNILRSLVLSGLVTQEQVDAIGAVMADLEREKACDLERLQGVIDRISKRLDFLMGFVGRNGDGTYSLSSEHSVGELVVKLRDEVKRLKGGQG